MSLETLTNITEFLLYAVPIAVLAVSVILYLSSKSHRKILGIRTFSLGTILYFLLKSHRKILGIVIITLGVVELVFYSYIIIMLFSTVNVNMIALIVVEVMTVLLGIFIYKNRLKEE